MAIYKGARIAYLKDHRTGDAANMITLVQNGEELGEFPMAQARHLAERLASEHGKTVALRRDGRLVMSVLPPKKVLKINQLAAIGGIYGE